jgi:hypothetical protein
MDQENDSKCKRQLIEVAASDDNGEFKDLGIPICIDDTNDLTDGISTLQKLN